MGTNFAPQWMKDDVNGTINNVVAGVNYLGKLATDGQTRQEAWNHMGQAVDSMVKSFMDDPVYALGGAAFEIASMFVGVGEVKAGITAARAGQGFLRGVAAFGKTVGRAAIRNADDLARGIGRLATRGVGLTKDLGQKMAAKFTSFKDDIARASAGLVDDVSTMARQTRNGFAYAMGGEVSDDFLKSGARVYNVGGEAAEGAGRRATAKFSQETSEAAVEHVDELFEITSDNITKEILETKPRNSPRPQKWLNKGGTIEVDNSKIPPEWIYTDWNGNTVRYADGFPDFKNGQPPQVKKEFIIKTGFEERYKDFSKAGSPGNGNTWHHHQDGKTLQAVDREIHRRFTHRGGISILKQGGK